MMRLRFLILFFTAATSITACDKMGSCLNSGGCGDSVNKVCQKDESKGQELCSKHFSPTPYLEDFEALKTHISKSYANLEYLLKHYQIDPYELNKQTISEIKAAKNERQAIDALKGFVKKFHDGHFKLREPKNDKSDRTNDNKKLPISKTTPAEKACTSLDFTWDKDYGFRFPIAGVTVKDRGGVEFPYLVFEGNKRRIGIVRVSDFRTTVYPKICIGSWEKYKTKFESSCDEKCQDDFIHSFMREAIVNQFYKSLEKVRAAKVDALVVDVTNNGGGTDWVEDITALTTTKPIVCGKSGFVKHPHHVNHFKEMLQDIKSNSPNDKQKISDMEEAIKIASQICDRTPIWTEKDYKLNCSLVGFRRGDQCKYEELRHEGKKKYGGKLFLLVNHNTASAAEDIVARHLDSKTATLIGSRTYGAGCGYMNGGIRFQLPNTGLDVRVPDCVRVRADGTNEVIGIEPSIHLDMKQMKDAAFLKTLLKKIGTAI
ncbi:MAG: hypothetical protein KDD33_05335 [Bdellovibrionales bacterium]|nr:hypothetical protein [Bdellovibrionales bacterium]